MVVQSYLARVEFLVLGPLRVLTADGPVEIRGAKERLLLGHLLARAGQVVATSELIDGLWGDDPPRTAAKSLQTYVLRLRNVLEPGRAGAATVLVTEGQGYRLAVDATQVDASRFTRLLAASRAGSPEERLALLDQALDLWRGTPYADLTADAVLAAESTRLEELRLGALESRHELELRAGQAGPVAAELERLVGERPERERLWALLMHALFLQGRQADALAAYERARTWLADEVGVDPGAELRQMHARVLAQDPALAPLDRDAAAAAVSAAVDEADRSRSELREAESRIATGILDLRRAAIPAPATPDRSPWPGLNAYEVEDGPWFAGRERLVAELIARVAGSPCVAVVGASGSGKSSAVRAGLLAGLADGQLPGSEAWERVLLRPGRHPMRELTRHFLSRRRPELGAVLERLVRTPEGAPDRTILVVDQLEELWTAGSEPGERTTFLDTLGALAADPEQATTVVLVLRADHLAHLADARQLADLAEESTVLVGAPSPDDVRRAVVLPAARAGLTFDDGLVDAIVGDAGAEPGLLPLLSTALAQLWEARTDHRLTFEAYVRLGGLASAIRHLAESTYATLGPAAQETMRAVLLRLAAPGEADLATRRRASLAELTALPLPGVGEVLDRLVAARLVTTDGDAVEVAHEALFREWPRLRDWLREDVAGRALRGRLAVAAADWEAEGRDEGLLWSGSRLAAAAELDEEKGGALTAVERAFLDAGHDQADAARVAAEQRARAKARQNRRLRLLLLGAIALLVLALVAGAVALAARDRAEDSARSAREAAVAADAKRLAASALSIEYPDLALLAAVEATSLEQSPETYGALLALLSRQPAVITRYRIADRFLRNAVTPDGSVVVLADNVGVLRGLDGTTGELLWERTDLGEGIGSLAMSPDGSVVAATAWAGESTVQGIDPRDGRTLWAIPPDRAVAAARGDASSYFWGDLGWSAEGRLVFASDSHLFVADAAGRVRHAVPWGRPMREPEVLTVWGDGRVSLGGADFTSGLVVGPVTGGERGPIREVDGFVETVSPDGRRAVLVRSGETSSEVELVDARTFRTLSSVVVVEGFVLDAAFAPDGRTFAIATDDEDVLLLDGRSGERVGLLSGHSGSVLNLAWGGADHGVLWTAGRDGTAVAFDVYGRHGVIRSVPSPDHPAAGESAAGVSIWSNSDPYAVNRAFLRGPDTRSAPLPLTGVRTCPCQVTSTALVPDGSVALGGYVTWHPGESPRTDIGHVVAWDTTTRDVVAVVRTPAPVTALAVLPEGDRAVVVTAVGWTMLDLRTFELSQPWAALLLLGLPVVTEAVSTAEVAPDGDRVALLRGNRVLVIDLHSREEIASVGLEEADDEMLSAAWAPDGSALMVGSISGRVHVLDGETLAPLRPTRLITGGFVIDIEISGDGTVAATMGTDGDVLLWDTATWTPYGLPVLDHGLWGYLSFEDDLLRVDHEEGTRSWVATDPERWVEAACEAANRDLTDEEFALLREGADYRPTCSARD